MTRSAATGRAVGVTQAVQIEVWGLHAERFAARHALACVAAVYARSLHLEADGDFLCVGDASIGNGPLNAIVQQDDWRRLQGSVPAAGAGVSITDNAIRIGGAVIETSAASGWRPIPWPPLATAKPIAAALQELDHVVQSRAPADSLARIALGLWPALSTALDRVAWPRVEALRCWLAARMHLSDHTRPPVELLGLGVGLTPSGDDLLCGALVALHAIARTEMARELHAAIERAAPTATGPLSRAFLKAADEGLGAEPLHAAIAALVQGRGAVAAGHVQALVGIGHTSGWDALAGAVLVLQAAGKAEGIAPESLAVRLPSKL